MVGCFPELGVAARITGKIRVAAWACLACLALAGCVDSDSSVRTKEHQEFSEDGATPGPLGTGRGEQAGELPLPCGASPTPADGQAKSDAGDCIPEPTQMSPTPTASTDNSSCRSECETKGERAEPLPSPSCPSGEPSVGSACADVSGLCGYGESQYGGCRSVYSCDSGVWKRDARFPGECPSQTQDYCPEDPTADGLPCIVSDVGSGVPCEFPEGIGCYCVGAHNFPGEQGSWECYAPPPNGDCPEVLPNFGEGCPTAGLQCRYGTPWGCLSYPYATVFCYQGRWEQGEERSCSE
jgi:hypothetical protein